MTDPAWHPYSADQQSGHQEEGSRATEPYRRERVPVARLHLRAAGTRGLTWRDLSALTGWHHGQASAALSNLHRTEVAVRLRDRRERCGIYVLPEYVHGRTTVPHRSNRTRNGYALTVEQVQRIIDRGFRERVPMYAVVDPESPSLAKLIARATQEGPPDVGGTSNDDQT